MIITLKRFDPPLSDSIRCDPREMAFVLFVFYNFIYANLPKYFPRGNDAR